MPPLPFLAGVFAAGVVLGGLGFGFGMVALACAAFFLPLSEALPPIAMLGWLLSGGLLVLLRRDFVGKDVLPVCAGAVLGVPAGTALLRWADADVLTGLLGVTLVVGTLMQLRKDPPREDEGSPDRVGVAAGAGVVGGVLGGALGAAAPPVVLFAAARPWSPQRTTAFMQGYLVVIGALQAVSYATAGLLGVAELRLIVGLAPAAGLGLLVGQKGLKLMPELVFRRIVLVVLFLLGLRFILKAFL